MANVVRRDRKGKLQPPGRASRWVTGKTRPQPPVVFVTVGFTRATSDSKMKTASCTSSIGKKTSSRQAAFDSAPASLKTAFMLFQALLRSRLSAYLIAYWARLPRRTLSLGLALSLLRRSLINIVEKRCLTTWRRERL